MTLKKWARTSRTCCRIRKPALSCHVSGRSRSGRNYSGCYWVRAVASQTDRQKREGSKSVNNFRLITEAKLEVEEVGDECRKACRWGRDYWKLDCRFVCGAHNEEMLPIYHCLCLCQAWPNQGLSVLYVMWAFWAFILEGRVLNTESVDEFEGFSWILWNHM